MRWQRSQPNRLPRFVDDRPQFRYKGRHNEVFIAATNGDSLPPRQFAGVELTYFRRDLQHLSKRGRVAVHLELMIRSYIYDALILRLTSRWYAEVLRRVCEGDALLDVGIGTAGALLANTDLVKRKRLRVTGIDIDADYIERARRRLSNSPLRNHAEVRLESVYDHQGGPYDAVYFSGSFMLLPEPEQALRHCCALLSPGGRIYFTQTIQIQPARWLEILKPTLKRVTSIDFGRVTYEDEFKTQIRAAGLELEEFTIVTRHGSRASCIAVTRPASTRPEQEPPSP